MKKEANQTISLKRRIASGMLTSLDEASRERSRRIYDGQARGMTLKRIAEAAGENLLTLRAFRLAGTYKTWHEHFKATEQGEVEVHAEDAKKTHRLKLQAMVPDALARLRASLTEGTSLAGKIVPSKAADRAMELVLEASGLLEQEGAGRPAVIIQQLVVNQQVASAVDDDQAIAALYSHVTEKLALPAPEGAPA